MKLSVLLLIVSMSFGALKYEDPTATGAGNGTSAADAWTTLQAAIDGASANDSVLILGPNQISTSLDFDGANGVKFIGTDNWDIDTLHVRWYGNGLTDMVNTFTSTGITFQNILFDGSVGVSDDIFNASGADAQFINCICSGAPDAFMVNQAVNNRFYDCIFKGNNRDFQFWVLGIADRCIFSNATTYSIDMNGTDNSVFINSLWFGTKMAVKNIDDNVTFINCAFDGDSSASVADTGLHFASTCTNSKLIDVRLTNLNVGINGNSAEVTVKKAVIFNSLDKDTLACGLFKYVPDSLFKIDPDVTDGYVNRTAKNYNLLPTATGANDTLAFPLGY